MSIGVTPILIYLFISSLFSRKQIYQNTENNEVRRSNAKVYHITSYRDSPVTYGNFKHIVPFMAVAYKNIQFFKKVKFQIALRIYSTKFHRKRYYGYH